MSVIGLKEKKPHEVLEKVASQIDEIDHIMAVYSKKGEDDIIYFSATQLPVSTICYFSQFMHWLSLDMFNERNSE